MPIKFHHFKKLSITVFLIVMLLLGAWAWIEKTYAHVALPGVKILNSSVAGKTQAEIVEILNKLYDEATRNGLQFEYKNRVATIYPEVVATHDPDLFYQLFKVNVEQTANDLVAYGHHANPLLDLPEILIALTVGVNKTVDYTLFQDALITALKENFGDLEHPALNPRPQYKNNQIEWQGGKPGISFDFKAATAELQQQIAKLNFKTIALSLAGDEPAVSIAEVTPLSPMIKQLVEKQPLVLYFENQEWAIERDNLLQWLDFKKDKSGVKLAIKQEEIFKFLTTVRKNVELKPIEAKFKIEGKKIVDKTTGSLVNDTVQATTENTEVKAGKVVEFQVSRPGRMLDYVKTSNLLSAALLEVGHSAPTSVPISAIQIEPRVTTDNVNNLGITEIIGIGESDFKGSPPNRIHNIKVGSAAVNGTLIAPGEELSLIKILGKIDGENGYKPELVIKGNKTTREFGGGLCQIGTTVFRGALASGLPILQRQNHSYRVPYYEPAGTDATIYSPKPDLKFKNDTKGHVLIQTKMVGTKLFFEFWGTKDGRQIELSSSTVYNIVKPEPPLLIPTEDLAVGKKSCTERAHNGADAKFMYVVTYPDYTKVIKEFKSHYKPWREVCLIGVAKGTLTASLLEQEGLPSVDASGADAQ